MEGAIGGNVAGTRRLSDNDAVDVLVGIACDW
jgi:hypothetical protein